MVFTFQEGLIHWTQGGPKLGYCHTPDDLLRLGLDSVNYKELGLGEFMFPSPNEQNF